MSGIEFEKPSVVIHEVDKIVRQYRNEHVKRTFYAGGVPNVTYIVEFDKEQAIALRIGNLGYTRKAHLEFEISVLAYLKQVGFTWSPCLVPLLDGSGYIGKWGKFPVIATKVISGITGDRVPVTAELCFDVGKAIGEMRICLAKYDGYIPEEEDLWSRTERFLNELETFSIEQSWDITPSLVIDAYIRAKESIQSITYINEVVHSDVWPPNIVAYNDHLSGILDFDDLTVGPGILDLAAAIGEFGFDRNSDILIQENVNAIIHGFYEVQKPISFEMRRMILSLIDISYCSWLACNAIHHVSFEESEIYYRRLNQLCDLSKRAQLEKDLDSIIINAQKENQ